MAKPEPHYPPQQFSASQALSFAVFGQEQHDSNPPTPILNRSGPCDFFIFPKLKLRMKGRRFNITEEIQGESQQVLDTIPKRDFQGCFQAWQKCWDHCIRAKGEYFEGDGEI